MTATFEEVSIYMSNPTVLEHQHFDVIHEDKLLTYTRQNITKNLLRLVPRNIAKEDEIIKNQQNCQYIYYENS